MFVVTMAVLAVMGGAVFSVLDQSHATGAGVKRWSAVLVTASSTALVAALLVAVVQVMRGASGG